MMKISDIKELIDFYDGVRKDPFEELNHYQKGFFRQMFHSRTEGMNRLHEFVNSPAIRSLDVNTELTGDNLSDFLSILQTREDRIYGTSRSYENLPNKSTNKIFNQLYKILWEDVIKKKLDGLENSDDYIRMLPVLFKREQNKALFQLESDVENNEEDASLHLGMPLMTGRPIEFVDAQAQIESKLFDENVRFALPLANEAGQRMLATSMAIEFEGQKVSVIYQLFSKAVCYFTRVIPNLITIGHDSARGFNVLNTGSQNGNKSCSMALARYYAGASESMKNNNPDEEKANEYLQLAASQGSSTATNLLSEGGQFGEITIRNSSPILR